MKNSKPNPYNFLYLFIIFAIALGQFGRYELGGNLAVYLHDILIVVLNFLWIASLFIKKRLPSLPKLWQFIPIFFVVASTSLLINNIDGATKLTGILYLLRWLNIALLFPVTHDLIQKKILNLNFSKLLLSAGVAVAVLGLIQYTFVPDTRFLYLLGWDDHYNRLIGTLFDPAYTGLILVFTLIVAWERKSSLLLQTLLLTALALTYSRASFLTFLLVLFVRAFTVRQSRKDSMIMGIIFVLMVMLLPTNLGEGTRLTRGYSVVSRAETSLGAFEIFKQNPILGTGFYNFRIKSVDQNLPSHSSAPDNSFALLLATTGIIGTLCYVFFLGNLIKNQTHNQQIIFTTVSLIIHSLTNNTLFYPFVTIWFWIMLGYSSAKTTKPANID